MIHLRPIPSKPSRIDVRTDRDKRKAIHSQLRKDIRKDKRRKPCPITYSHS